MTGKEKGRTGCHRAARGMEWTRNPSAGNDTHLTDRVTTTPVRTHRHRLTPDRIDQGGSGHV